MNEEDLLKSYFTEQDVPGMTHDQFEIAMIGLIEKGLMEMIEHNGMRLYRPTLLAQKMKSHLNSDLKSQN
jgi:predicted transcriptional regulator with HTH domain